MSGVWLGDMDVRIYIKKLCVFKQDQRDLYDHSNVYKKIQFDEE